MFEIAELGQSVTKEEYEEKELPLREDLVRLQHTLKSASFNVMVVFVGIEGGGKGETLYLLHQWMDPRFLMTHVYGKPFPEEAEQPYSWQFWRAMPPHGRIGIFYRAWYAEPLVRRFRGNWDDDALDAAMQHINTFEEMLVADGTLLLKFWFHMSKPALKRRVKELKKDKERRWQVKPVDEYFVDHYDAYREVSERALRQTNTGVAPWKIIDAADWRYRNLSVAEHLRDSLAHRLPSTEKAPQPQVASSSLPPPVVPHVSILNKLDLTQHVSKDEYEEKLPRLQADVHALTRRSRKKRVTSVLVFEGWDAAGKGSAIRRLAAAINPRDYRIVPVAAPNEEELAHHYLWRFWRQLPHAGQVVVFDRSWYGRVLVERVEGFAKEEEWRRAYKEINDFEQQLDEHGIVVMKFWLHISKDEQLRRFQERSTVPFKQFKITEEDYRNRAKWEAYDAAVNEMVERCSTEYAPWTLVEGNDKHFARLKVMRTFRDRLKERV